MMGFSEDISYVEQTAKVKIANATRLDATKSPIKFTVQAKVSTTKIRVFFRYYLKITIYSYRATNYSGKHIDDKTTNQASLWESSTVVTVQRNKVTNREKLPIENEIFHD